MSLKRSWSFVSHCGSLQQFRPYRIVTGSHKSRHSSSTSITSRALEAGSPYQKLNARVKLPERTFERLSTKVLLRSVILGQIFKTPWLFKPGLYLLTKVANSKSILLNADRNPLIREFVLPLIYRQFCAGRNVAEVKQTISDIKGMGYSGVILCYSGEVMARKDVQGNHSEIDKASSDDITTNEIETWRDGHLATLEAVGEGDYVGVKYTGAGPSVSEALKNGRPPSAQMQQALYQICKRAKALKIQVWFDAEQQVYHPGIDEWTIDLMRRYNSDGHALVLTTIQAYLKSARQTTENYIRRAQKEGWKLGIKLVRGAYIASDVRSNIHNTKGDTDACYDSIVHDIVSKDWPGLDKADFPHVHLFIAGHNTNSVRKASMLTQRLAQQGKIDEQQCYGQLQGMADDIGCELLALGDQSKEAAKGLSEEQLRQSVIGAPKAYKCLTWGSVKECLHYLVRRAVENQGAVERMNTGLTEMKYELRRRILRF